MVRFPMRSPTGRRMTNWSTGLRRNILECLCLTRHRFLTCPRMSQRHWSHCPSTAEPVVEELQEDAQAAVEEPPVDAKTHRARKRSSAASAVSDELAAGSSSVVVDDDTSRENSRKPIVYSGSAHEIEGIGPEPILIQHAAPPPMRQTPVTDSIEAGPQCNGPRRGRPSAPTVARIHWVVQGPNELGFSREHLPTNTVLRKNDKRRGDRAHPSTRTQHLTGDYAQHLPRLRLMGCVCFHHCFFC